MDCDEPPPPLNGRIENSSQDSVIIFRCNEGFIPSTEMMAICTSDGEWEPVPELLECRKYEPIFFEVTRRSAGLYMHACNTGQRV